MKIMMLVSSSESGGVETHIAELVRGLLARGHRVVLVSDGGELAFRTRRAGAVCVRLGVSRTRPLSVLGAYIALSALIKRERPDIVHAHSRIFGVLARRIISLQGGHRTGYVSTVHAKFSTDGCIRRLPWLGSFAIAVGEDLKQYALDLPDSNILPEHIEVIENGIDTARFCPAPRGRGDTHFRICFMSRLERDCSAVAESLCRLAPRINYLAPRAEIYIIGGGECLEHIRALAQRTNLAVGRCIVFAVGSLSAPEKILKRCDLFVGVSRAALEAMSCALPVILAGNEGYMGILCKEGDVKSACLSNFCCRGEGELSDEKLFCDIKEIFLLGDKGRQVIGKKMRELVRKDYSAQKMVRDTEKFYKKVQCYKRRQGKEILLCGYYGYGNTGDDIQLVQSFERATRDFSGGGISALARGAREAAAHFGISCVERENPIAVARAVSRCSVLVLGGGSLLQSGTSVRSLLWYSSLIFYAKMCGARVELWGNGLGGFSCRLSEKLASRALLCADYVGLRDKNSLSLAKRLIRERAIVQSVSTPSPMVKLAEEQDLSSLALPSTPSRIAWILSRLEIGTDEKFAVVSLRNKIDKRSLSEVCRVLDRLALSGVRLVFVPMYPAQDTKISARLARKYNAPLALGLGAEDIMGLVSRARAVISARYHTLLFADRFSVRSIAIGKDEKFLNFLIKERKSKTWFY